MTNKFQTHSSKQPMLIPSTWTLPDELRQRIGTTVGRQRFMSTDDQHLILSHHVPEHDEVMRRGILFWRDASGDWRASNGDPGKAAIEMHLDRYAKRLEEFDEKESKATNADDYLPILEGLAPITRSARNLLQVLEDARKAIPDDRTLIDHRDRAYDISRTSELLYEDAKNSMDVAVVRKADEQARATHEMAQAAHRLNLLAAMFFPFATLGAIFGTTLTDNWSWSHSVFPFILYLLLGIVIGLVMTQFVIAPKSEKDRPKST